MIYPFVLTPVSSFSSSAICPASTSASSGVFVKNKIHAELYTNYYNGGVIMGDDILFYDSMFGSCDTGMVSRVSLTTGIVTNTSYMINGTAPMSTPINGQPIYHDGTHLWLLSKCSMDGDTLVNADTGATLSINASLQLNLNNKQMIYSKTNGNEYLYWYDRSRNDVYYYDIASKDINCLQLSDDLRNYDVGREMAVYNTLLLWLPSREDQLFTTYDLISGQYGTLASSDLSTLDRGSYIDYTRGKLMSRDDEIILYRNLNNNGIGYGSVFVTLTLTPPSSPRTRSSTTISTTLALNNPYIGRSYLFMPNGTFTTYRNLPTTDVAYGCITSNYHYVNEQHILLAGFYTYFAKPSIPNTMTIGSNDYDVESLDKLPKRCLTSVTVLPLSFSSTYNTFNYDHVSSSKISNKLLLVSYNYTGSNTFAIYDFVTKVATPIMLTPPSLSQYQSYQFMFPVSVNTEYDFWLYNGYTCQLVSTTNASTITLPGMLPIMSKLIILTIIQL